MFFFIFSSLAPIPRAAFNIRGGYLLAKNEAEQVAARKAWTGDGVKSGGCRRAKARIVAAPCSSITRPPKIEAAGLGSYSNSIILL